VPVEGQLAHIPKIFMIVPLPHAFASSSVEVGVEVHSNLSKDQHAIILQ
jgi:hypothetical protein